MERLGQVAVGSGGEPGQSVGEVVAGRQEDDRGGEPARPQRLADVPAVRVGQADVQDDGRGVEVLVEQAAAQHATQGVIVLDDQDLAAHGPP